MDSRIIELGGFKNGYFKRNIYVYEDDKESINNFIREYKNTDVYYSIYSYSCIDNIDSNDTDLLGPLYFDFDDSNIEYNYKEIKREVYQLIASLKRDFKIPINLIKIYFSGHKGFHIIIPYEVFNIKADTTLNIKYKKLVKLFFKEYNLTRLDTKIYDKKRLFRIPNSINSKSNLRKIYLPFSVFINSNFEDIIHLSNNKQNESSSKPFIVKEAKKIFNYLFTITKTNSIKHQQSNNLKEVMPCISSMLNTNVQEGKRNNTAIVLASSLFQSNKTKEEVLNLLCDWNKNNEPPLNERELLTTISSAESMYKQNKKYGCSTIKDLGMCVNNCKWNTNSN